ncbi:AraC family transcriptional regulator [Flammeovirga sp. SubArs3]|uniref:helix-turn-helix domain-containing protein n=1 Tax=Flammeovirga sp. SubArs3 TaxID=2995316 RepID=UPI00248CC6E7|nr:AraC family transcriptional regulator [Flammeovirga sp. SubArs3]
MLKIKTHFPEFHSDLIERFWMIENTEAETKVVTPPSQYVNIIFPIGTSNYKRNESWVTSPQIEGISLQNNTITYPPNTKVFGIRLFAYGLYPFFQFAGKEIMDTSIPIQLDGFPFITEHKNDDALIKKLEKTILSHFSVDRYNEIKPILNFYQKFRWNDENESIERFCKDSETNYTSLNRLFSKVIGISPKKFERLIKFRKSLCSIIDSQEQLTSIGINSGYFDQAHFIREFKLFLHQTPSEYKKMIKEADKESNIINYNFKLH